MKRHWQIDCDFKLNIYLDITGKLANGYHSLDSLFVRVPGGDRLDLDLVYADQILSPEMLDVALKPDYANFSLELENSYDLSKQLVLSESTFRRLKAELADNLLVRAWRYLRTLLVLSLAKICYANDYQSLVANLRKAQMASVERLCALFRALPVSLLEQYLAALCLGKWSFSLQKRVPVQSGLGAGSFDAAAVWQVAYRVLNDMAKSQSNLPFDLKTFIACFELSDIAYNLGADIPFALQTECQSALVKGIGEDIQILSNVKPFHILLVKPNVAVSSKAAFLACDQLELKYSNYKLANLQSEPELARQCWKECNLTSLAKYAKNSFYELACLQGSELLEFNNQLRQLVTADFMSMSGSGSTFFLLFKDKVACDMACTKLLKLVDKSRECGENSEFAWLLSAQLSN